MAPSSPLSSAPIITNNHLNSKTFRIMITTTATANLSSRSAIISATRTCRRVPPPLYGTSSSIPPGSTMQPSTSFAFHTSHSTYNPSFDSSNLYNLAFRLPEYPTSSSSLSTTGGKQFQQSSALFIWYIASFDFRHIIITACFCFTTTSEKQLVHFFPFNVI